MLFRKKGWLRKQYNESLHEQISRAKEDWSKKKAIIERSVEPSDFIVSEWKTAEAKYFFLLKEAKKRKLSAGIFKL